MDLAGMTRLNWDSSHGVSDGRTPSRWHSLSHEVTQRRDMSRVSRVAPVSQSQSLAIRRPLASPADAMGDSLSFARHG